jgi:S-(hydroxymethyl)glutathione dehydrogenase/alcohol dehydrogenase
MVQAAALVSADPIIAVDLYDNRLELARRLGATHAINGRSADVRARILDIVGQQGPDVFIDNTGLPAVIELGYDLTPAEGRVILVGVPHSDRDIAIHSLPLHFGKVLQGSHGGGTLPQRDIPRYQRLHARGRLRLEELITARFALDEINDAIAAMRDGRIQGRVLITMPD